MVNVDAVEGLPPPHVTFVRYVVFAVVAGLANLGTQELVHRSLPNEPLFLAILAGTAVGFVTKYLLDKRWIFVDRFQDRTSEARKVALYGLFSVATTALFWGTELAAWYIWQTPTAKYAGAVAGLALGNWLKYRLDKRYVFNRGRA